MFIDGQTQLASSLALSATGVLTNVYDCGAPGVSGGLANDPSVGEPLCVIIAVIVGAAAGGTQTYEFDINQSTVAALSAPDTLAAYAFTTARALALLTTGAVLALPIPPGSITKEFIGVNFIGANTPTITISAWIAPMSFVQMQKSYGTKIVIL